MSISSGADGIPGTGDDLPAPLPGTRVVHWFRTDINDPYLSGPAVVDNTTYTRVVQNLPSGDHWPANANRLVGGAMGYGNAQSAMFTLGSRRTTLSGLIPDDVNTIAYGQAGLDEVLGADDYSYTLAYVPDCAGANVEVEFVMLGPDAEIGNCGNLYVGLPIPGQPTVRHYALDSSTLRSSLQLNSSVTWAFQFILWSDFELGDASEWTLTVP